MTAIATAIRAHAIRAWLKAHPEYLEASPDATARAICFWSRVRVNRYDVLAITPEFSAEVR